MSQMRALDLSDIEGRVTGDVDALRVLAHELSNARQSQPVLPEHINLDPESVEQSLAKLVLTVIELLRQLMERQALRRIDAGSLTDDEIERMGQTFMKLEQKMAELRDIFGLNAEDLNLDLGPLGHLLPKE